MWCATYSSHLPSHECLLLLVIVDQAAGGNTIDINRSVVARRSGGIRFNSADLEHKAVAAGVLIATDCSSRVYPSGWGPLACEWRAHCARQQHQEWVRAQRGKRTLQSSDTPLCTRFESRIHVLSVTLGKRISLRGGGSHWWESNPGRPGESPRSNRYATPTTPEKVYIYHGFHTGKRSGPEVNQKWTGSTPLGCGANKVDPK